MNAFYSSDEDIAWGKVTPREIKGRVKGQVRKKPQQRHTTSNLSSHSYSSKEAMDTSANLNVVLSDITNKCNISGTSTQYFTANDTFKSGTKKSFNTELPRIHVHPVQEMMLDNFQATLVNNTMLSEDAGYDVSVLSSENDVCSPDKDSLDSVIIISDDESADQNSFEFRQGSSELLAKLKYERISNCEADTSDYHENVSMESGNVSRRQLNTSICLSLSSTDENTDEECIRTAQDDLFVALENSDSENIPSSNIENEISQHIQDRFSAYYDSASENEMDSMEQQDIQAADEISNPESNDHFEQYDVPKNTEDATVSIHSYFKSNRDIDLNDSNHSSFAPEKDDLPVDNDKGQEAQDKINTESPIVYTENRSDGSEDSDLIKFNDSNSNKEEFNNTLEMVERMLNQQLEIPDQRCVKKNETSSTKLSSASNEKSRIPKLLKSPQISDTFKVPQTVHKQKLHTPKSTSKINFKDIVSPVGLYIKYSPQPVLKQNVTAVEFKSPAHMRRMAASPQVSKPNRNNHVDFPAAIYKPPKKQITSSAKKLFLPPSLEKMVREPNMVKHEGIINRHHDESDIDRKLLSENELTRSSISDSVLDYSTHDISVLTTKHTFK